jgi:hypothetical protein
MCARFHHFFRLIAQSQVRALTRHQFQMRPIIQPNAPAAEHFPAGWNFCQQQARFWTTHADGENTTSIAGAFLQSPAVIVAWQIRAGLNGANGLIHTSN